MRLLVFLLLLPCFCFGQNLVPNPSFEVMDTCPSGVDQVRYAVPWFQPSLGSSDYYNACWVSGGQNMDVPANFFGYQNAKNGGAYTGLYVHYNVLPSYREYVEVELTDSLQAGIKYYASFYVSLADSSNYATDDIGAYFSNDSLQKDTGYLNFNVIPQVANPDGNFIIDKQNWLLIFGSFIAQGGEKFITIGNFKNAQNTDTIAVLGGKPGLDWDSYYYVDDVCVSTDSIECGWEVGIKEKEEDRTIDIYPNPTTGTFTVQGTTGDIQVYDLFGSLVLRTNKKQVDMSTYPTGIYMVRVGQAVRKLILH